jgi:hypothetical protein
MPRKINKTIKSFNKPKSTPKTPVEIKISKGSAPGRKVSSTNTLTDASISIESSGVAKNFSFKTEQKSKAVFEAANVKKDLAEVENEYDIPDDKFPNEVDPFYKPDERDTSYNKEIKNVEVKNISTNLTRALFSNTNATRIKQVL